MTVMAALFLSVVFSANQSAFAQTGALESANCDEIKGWAYDDRLKDFPADYDQPRRVAIYDFDAVITETYAGNYRPDLAGKGNGYHGFAIPTPESLKDGKAHSIRAVMFPSDVWFLPALGPVDLTGAPKSLTCGGADDANLSYTMDMLFKTQNQSIWKSDQTSALTWTSGEAMYVNWGPWVNSDSEYADISTPSERFCVWGLPEGFPPHWVCKEYANTPSIGLGTFGAGGNVDTAGKMGIRIDAMATAGSVDINAPVKVNLSYPANSPIGSFFAVDTNYALDPAASTMNTFSPNASAKLFIFAEGNFGAGANVKGFSKDIFDFSIPKKDFKIDAEVFDTTTFVNHQLREHAYEHGFPAADFRATLRYPVINTAGALESPTTLSSSGHDWLIRLTVDLTSIVTNSMNMAGIPMPPLVMDLTFPADKAKGNTAGSSVSEKNPDSKWYEVALRYQILDAYLNGDLGFQQDFKFTPKPMITLVAKDRAGRAVPAYKDRTGSQPLSFPVVAGTQVWYKMPPSGIVTITPKAEYDGDFRNTTSIRLAGRINLDQLAFRIGGSVGNFPGINTGIPIPYFSWTAIPTLTKEFPVLIPLPEFTPKLAGWSAPIRGTPFSIASTESTLASITRLDKVAVDEGVPTEIVATSRKIDWNLANTKFYWDTYDADTDQGTPLNSAPHTTPKQVKLNPTAEMLKPGVHKIIAVVSGDAEGTKFNRVSSADLRVRYPKPKLTALTRVTGAELDSVPADSPAMGIVLAGTGFNSVSKVYIDGKPMNPDKIIEIEPTKMRVSMPNVRFDAPGSYNLTVANPLPGGGISNALKLTVASSIPTIQSFTPDAVLMEAKKDANLKITGTNFVPNSVIKIEGKPIKTLFISKTVLSGRIPQAMLDRDKLDVDSATAAQPTLDVVVSNPKVTSAKGVKTGGDSRPKGLEVTVPPPYITAVKPRRAWVGSDDVELTITGRNFFRGSTLIVKDQKAPNAAPGRYRMTFVSPTQLTVTLPAAAMKKAAVLELNVVNRFVPKPVPRGAIEFPVIELPKAKPGAATPGAATP